MIIEYFSYMSDEDLNKLINAYYDAIESNCTEFDFEKYTVNTTFAKDVFDWHNITIEEINKK